MKAIAAFAAKVPDGSTLQLRARSGWRVPPLTTRLVRLRPEPSASQS